MRAKREKAHTSAPTAPFRFDYLVRLTQKRLELRANKVGPIRQPFPELAQVSDKRLKACLLEALEEYYLWHCKYGAFCEGTGATRSIARLETSLTRVIALLEEPGVMNRIHIARQFREGTDKSPVPGAFDYSYNPLKDPKLAAAKLRELLELVAAARKLSRPELDISVGGDLRAAALPLYRLWVQGAGQSDKMWKGGGRQYSRSVLFLTHCLKLIDGRVTKRLVADFQLDPFRTC